jgi:hypothetical protein
MYRSPIWTLFAEAETKITTAGTIQWAVLEGTAGSGVERDRTTAAATTAIRNPTVFFTTRATRK